MARCPSALIASTTRRNACLHRSRRSEILLKGMYVLCGGFFSVAGADSMVVVLCRAKYIEGLENRLGRMESLLKLSGLLSEEDGGKTDLGTLEKRLADRSMSAGAPSAGAPSAAKSPNRFTAPPSATQSQQNTASRQSTPRVESQPSPHTAPTSPESQKDSEPEVEGLSDMMCSLVTNNCGETRYIGMRLCYLAP